ncbi:hypothetical protein L2E82_50920 [Cichorium intybus]|nr:hypothetical protein L2E82_50920 [Cichorium intybus]
MNIFKSSRASNEVCQNLMQNSDLHALQSCYARCHFPYNELPRVIPHVPSEISQIPQLTISASSSLSSFDHHTIIHYLTDLHYLSSLSLSHTHTAPDYACFIGLVLYWKIDYTLI